MNKTNLFTILFSLTKLFIFLLGLCWVFSSCNKPSIEHSCKWSLCPYKGITLSEYSIYAEYEPGSDAYKIDSLHLIYPSFDYDQLDSILFIH